MTKTNEDREVEDLKKNGAELKAELADLELQLAEMKKNAGPLLCPERWNHKAYQGRVCPGCGPIPGGGQYDWATITRYFPAGAAAFEIRRDPESVYTETEGAVMLRYQELDNARAASEEKLAQLRRDRATLPSAVTINGQLVDTSEHSRGQAARLDQEILAAEKQIVAQTVQEQAWLQHHTELGKIRQARGGSAVPVWHAKWLADRGESETSATTPVVPEPATPLSRRIGEAFRGLLT